MLRVDLQVPAQPGPHDRPARAERHAAEHAGSDGHELVPLERYPVVDLLAEPVEEGEVVRAVVELERVAPERVGRQPPPSAASRGPSAGRSACVTRRTCTRTR